MTPSRTWNYKGYEMRSVAEARWAAFFDICGIGWQYEPINTGTYIPDFLLLGEQPVLIEIKGGATTLSQVREQTGYVASRLESHWDGYVLLLGASPLIGLSDPSDLEQRDCVGIMMWQPDDPRYQKDGRWRSDSAFAAWSLPPHYHHSCSVTWGQAAYGFSFGYRCPCPRDKCVEWPYGCPIVPWGCNGGDYMAPRWPRADLEAKWAQATNTVRHQFKGRAA